MDGPPARILMVKDYTVQELLARDKTLNRVFAGRTTYVLRTSATGSAVPPLPGTPRPAADYASYAIFAADIAAGRLPKADHAVLYDIEKWPQTPLAEQQNPLAYMLRFGKLARQRGLLPILAPARDLVLAPGASCPKRHGENLSQAYIRCGLARADTYAGIFVVQSQADQFDVSRFRSFLILAARQARAANPHVTVLAQLATAPLGHPASLAQLVAAARSVRDVVQGYSLNVRASDIATADALFRSFRR